MLFSGNATCGRIAVSLCTFHSILNSSVQTWDTRVTSSEMIAILVFRVRENRQEERAGKWEGWLLAVISSCVCVRKGKNLEPL